MLNFLRREYGPQATDSARSRDAAWEAASDAPYRYWVCAEGTAPYSASVDRLLAICGELQRAGHGQGGLLDLYAFRVENDVWIDVARERGMESGGGSYGHPGLVSEDRFGPDAYGFRIESGMEYGGHTSSSVRFVMASPDGIRAIGEMTSEVEHFNGVPCRNRGKMGIHDLSTSLNLDYQFEKTASAAVWPLRIHVQGVQCCRTMWQQYRVLFDQRKLRYAMPSKLMQSRIACPKGVEEPWPE